MLAHLALAFALAFAHALIIVLVLRSVLLFVRTRFLASIAIATEIEIVLQQYRRITPIIA
jgi:hypothetical protein